MDYIQYVYESVTLKDRLILLPFNCRYVIVGGVTGQINYFAASTVLFHS